LMVTLIAVWVWPRWRVGWWIFLRHGVVRVVVVVFFIVVFVFVVVVFIFVIVIFVFVFVIVVVIVGELLLLSLLAVMFLLSEGEVVLDMWCRM